MSRQITISQEDLQNAEQFLAEFLTESVTEASFIEGSAVRDLAVKAFSYVFAYLRKENALLDAKRSLKQVMDALDSGQEITNVNDIVDEIMSNWFITRQDGTLARLTATLHFTRKGTVSISRETRFWRTNTLAFYVDASSFPYVISELDMLPTFDVRGRLVDYTVNIPLRSARIGEGYNFAPGTFVKVDAPGGLPYFSHAEHKVAAAGGLGVETNLQVIDRAQTAVTVRNLINNRSCDTVLRDLFSDVQEVLCIGMAEAEMMRDLRTEIGSHLRLHVGGHYDTYVEMPLSQVEENLKVGAFYSRPDRIINVFRDPFLTYDSGLGNFTALGVLVGQVLYIREGIAGAPRGYIITKVSDHELEVSENMPFEEASDELDVNAVKYSIGQYDPDFFDVIPPTSPFPTFYTAAPSVARPDVPYGTSRRICRPGMVVLTGQPVQDILSVELKDPDPLDAGIVDPSTKTIFFNDRRNGEPNAVLIPGMSQYQFTIPTRYKAQSADSLQLVNVGYQTDPTHFDGKTLRVSYSTFRGFTNVSDYIRTRDNRILAGNHLLKARHPVWVRCTIPYRLKPTSASTLDETAASEQLSAYINAFDPNDDLDMNDLATQLRVGYPIVGTVFPFDIYYDLYSPDGQLIQFKTMDIVSIFSLASNGVVLLNGADIIVPPEMIAEGITEIETDSQLSEYLTLMGVSDRTSKYRCKPSLITFAIQG